jgi:acetylglutamate kinase
LRFKKPEIGNQTSEIPMAQCSLTARAEVLIEALPYIQKYRGQLFVIKYGGSAMDDDQFVDRLLRDVVFLEAVGVNPVLIHGGGKAITARMREAGLKPRFVAGLRVTDEQSIRIVEDVLDREVNPHIVEKIRSFGGKAVGLSGRRVFKAEKLPPQKDDKGGDLDLGFVGTVNQVDLAEVHQAVAEETVPVISPIGQGADGTPLNVNADVGAGALAGALNASKLIFVSDVPGLMRHPADKDSLIPTVNRDAIEKLIAEGVIEGGMIPKVESAVSALNHGVGKVHLIDGRVAHSLLLEIFTNQGIGTEITA